MATARAQGGLRGEMRRFFYFSARSPSFFPTCSMVHPSTTCVTRAGQGKRSRKSQDLAPEDRVSHRMEHADMNPYWVNLLQDCWTSVGMDLFFPHIVSTTITDRHKSPSFVRNHSWHFSTSPSLS